MSEPCSVSVTRLRWRGQHGDAGPLEAVVLMPAILLLFAFIVAAGRTTTASGDVEHAARVGARAAVSAQSSGGADVRAKEAAAASLVDSGLSCTSHSVSVSGSPAPGGSMTVTVTCVASMSDIVQFGVPGSKTLRESATERVDVVRGG